MSEQFKVGEVARHIPDPANTADIRFMLYSGEDCEIIGPLDWYNAEDGTRYYSYDVRFSDGFEGLCAPHELRKKHPPRSAKSIMREVIAKAKQPCEVPA